ncbi:MAG TPA: glutamate racemase [Firmicutes bacterium]|nr:glutamate racemase [Bacillota bacterium]
MDPDAFKAIGILDSGVGGLTVLQEIYRQLPDERIVYFGDTARMPYGPRSPEEVRRFALEIVNFLQTQEIKLLVVACNSATAAGLPYYQQSIDLPVVGVIEPGVRAALSYTRNCRVGIIGTAGTISSSVYQSALKSHNPNIKIFSRACPLFVLLVENDLVDTPEAEKVAGEYLDPFREAGIDTLILGCTHYPLMSGLIQQVIGPQVRLVSSAEETAVQVNQILTSRQLLNPLPGGRRSHRFFVSGAPAGFEALGSKLLKRRVKAYQVLLS